MRTAALLAIAALPLAVPPPYQSDKSEPPAERVHVTGCVRGSTLTETNLRMTGGEPDGTPKRRWRLRASKALMKQIKQQADKEVEVTGTVKDRDASIGGTRIGNTQVFIGGNPDMSRRDPLPDLPTIDVQSFELTGEKCR